MLKIFFVVMFFIMCEGKPGLLNSRRGLCPKGGGDKSAGCGKWKKLGYCDKREYAAFMKGKCPATCGFCQARPTEPPTVHTVRVNINECLRAHNSKRALHGAKPLTWDSSLAKKAQDWALYLANNNEWKHATLKDAGENLYLQLSEAPATCKDAVESWYGEIKDYPFQNPPYSIFDVGADIGHFTQVVWKSTKKVGVGIASVKQGFTTKTYVVARYTPPGNYRGELGQEVGKKING